MITMRPPVQYEQPEYIDSSFPIIFHEDYMSAVRRAVYTNWHAGIEVLYCLTGKGRLLQDGNAVEFGAGDMVVINSKAIHTLHLVEDPCNYYCMIIEPSFLQAHGLRMEGLYFRALIRDEGIHQWFEQVAQHFQEMGGHYKPLVLAKVLLMFVEMAQRHAVPAREATQMGERRGQQVVIQAIDYIHAHLFEPIRIEQISRHVGMSKYYFCRQFLAHTGTSVNHHINALKCDYAHKLLTENGFNVSEAARHMGFQNLSYFAKLYKKHVGILPSGELHAQVQRKPRNDVFGAFETEAMPGVRRLS